MSSSKMDVDTKPVDAAKYLEQQRQLQDLPPKLQEFFRDFQELHAKKLWHQLTVKVEEFINIPESGPYQIGLYRNFVVDWQARMNQLKLIQIGLNIAKQFRDYKEALEFLSELTEKVNKPTTQEAYVLAVMETAHFQLLVGDLEGTQQAMGQCGKILDEFDRVEPIIHASYYRVSGDYYKAKADYVEYYRNSLLYLACINLDDLSKEDQIERAHDLSLAALLGEIYSFGELLMHPILDTLNGTDHEWLKDLLFAFNAGDIAKFESAIAHFSKQPLLQQSLAFLRQKICLMSLIEAVFKRNADDRTISFKQIALETRLPSNEVEHLVMKALSLKLIRGHIDQVDEVVRITWVQPRVLDKTQIEGMRLRLDSWSQRTKKLAVTVENETPELFVQ